MNYPFTLALGWGALSAAWVLRARPVAARRAFALRSGSSRPSAALARALPSGRRLALLLLFALASAALFPPAGLAVLLVACVRPFTAKRRAVRDRAAAVERDLADVVALIGLAVSAGCNLSGALEAAATHTLGPLAEALHGAVATTRRGARLADALEALPEQLGESVRGLVAALVACDRYGAALGPTLDRLAIDVRTASRQRAEAAARRLPVRLLFPLVTCILPAFALLTVAPLIAGSFQGLSL